MTHLPNTLNKANIPTELYDMANQGIKAIAVQYEGGNDEAFINEINADSHPLVLSEAVETTLEDFFSEIICDAYPNWEYSRHCYGEIVFSLQTLCIPVWDHHQNTEEDY